MSDSSPITPDVARVLAEWSELRADRTRDTELAEVFAAFRRRVERLYAMDVGSFEFDFLHPMSHES